MSITRSCGRVRVMHGALAVFTAIILLCQSTLLGAATAAASADTASAARVRAAGSCGASDVGTRTVVVLVHGFHSDITTWTKKGASMLQSVEDAAPGRMYIRLFDYGRTSTQWVANSGVGGQLADLVRCLAVASREGGGAGKVVLVGHSMGGLAIRCSLDPGCTTDALDPELVGMIITAGTPHRGSFWRRDSIDNAVDTVGGLVILALCDTAHLAIEGAGVIGGTALNTERIIAACALIQSLGPSSAGRAFTVGSAALRKLAPFPGSIPVRAIAGSGRVPTGIGIWRPRLLTTPVGDFVVDVDSQLAEHTNDRLGGTRTIDCGLAPFNTCTHLDETSYGPFRAAIRDAITDYTKRIDISSATLSNIGFGPFHPGMTYPEASAVASTLGLKITAHQVDVPCRFISPAGNPYVVYLTGVPAQMKVAVVEVSKRGFRTDRGIGIGSTKADVTAAYPKARVMMVEPSLTALVEDFSDGTALRFDLDPATNRVDSLLGGDLETVHAYEICS